MPRVPTGRPLRPLAGALLLALLAPAALRAATSSPAADGAALPPRGSTLAWRVTHDLGPLFAAPAHWREPQWKELGEGAVLIGTARIFDARLRESTMRPASEDPHRYDLVRTFGQEGGLALLGTTWLAGTLAHRPEVRSVAVDGLEAVLLSAGIVTPALKLAVGRARPNQGEGPSSFHPFGGDYSFPSGEVTEAFAIASVIAAHDESFWVKDSAWAIAGAVGWARMRADAHWASDVAAGALVGGSVGSWVAHRHLPRSDDEARIDLMPLAAPHGGGIELFVRF